MAQGRDKQRRWSKAQKKRRTSTNGRAPRRGPQLSTVLAVGFMVAGSLIIAYPTVANWWNQYHQSRTIATYVEAIESTDAETLRKMIADAQAYNQRLVTNPNRYLPSESEHAEYESLLDLTGQGIMGYIQIPIIGVNLPIYHGVDPVVLQIAIGHFEGSSLPVGGAGTHVAVSGHRGLPSAKLFSELDKLKEGDTFTITVLDQILTYEVDQVRIVDPTDLRDLEIDPKQDYVTLVTCTPYGVNTHRLLVRGHRIENLAGSLVVSPDAVQIPNYIAVPAVGIPMLFAYLIGALVHYSRIGKYNKEKVIEELREQANVEAQDE